MAVPEQTPYKEYIGNGVTKIFPLEFDCNDKDHLVVFIDENEPVVGDWQLDGGVVIFKSAPKNGAVVKVQRNTPFRRDRDYQSYDNSFRPPVVNKDFDWIWWKLQELGVADWILSNRIDALKAYVDDRDDELRAYLMEEIRKQGVALDQLDDYYNYLMQKLAEIAVNGGWLDSFVTTWSGRTQEQKNKDSIHVLDFKVGDKTGQEAIQDAVNYCLANNRTLDWDGAYLTSTGSFTDFWKVTHLGRGAITRGVDTFYITPVNDQLSILHVGSTGDGLSADSAMTLNNAVDVICNLGSKALNGQWRMQLTARTHNYTGVFLKNLPYFSKPLQIYGSPVADGAEPDTFWDGAFSTASYALRTNHNTTCANYEMKYIHFKNWQNSAGNAGAFITDDKSVMTVDRCRFTACEIGLWVLQSYIKVNRCTFTDCSTWGVCVQYLSYGNIGSLTSGYGNSFIRCGIGAIAGRNSIMYVQGNNFTEIGVYAIEYNKLSRGRTQKNTYTSFGANALSVINVVEGAIYNPDNNSGYPDIINVALSPNKPFMTRWCGGLHSQIHTKQPRYLHSVLDYKTTSYNTVGERKNLNDFDITTHPFRLPLYTLYSPEFKLEVELDFYVQAGQSLLIELTGSGTSLNSRLAYVQTTAPAENKTVRAKITVERYSVNSQAFFTIEIPALNQYIYRQQISESVFSNAQVVGASETLNAFRLWATLSQSTSVLFYGARTYVEM